MGSTKDVKGDWPVWNVNGRNNAVGKKQAGQVMLRGIVQGDSAGETS